MKYLIVGLGNIGPEYRDTRHNIGFKVLDAFAKASNTIFEEKRHGSVALAKVKGHALLLLKPNTFMNNSGRAVNYWMQKEKVELPALLVVGDDLALPLGAIRLRAGGSDGGHNGLKSVAEWLGSRQYARLRVGIGDDFRRGGQVDYVLGRWTPEEQLLLPAMQARCEEMISAFVLTGVERTMNVYNNKEIAPEDPPATPV
ncbi:MAG: aminoacyl-tRNA hydrolase [Odoribacteraceae bacterium]|jgi:PTH1 family peptidyl-tRNA hydrolase|nr:aminoacyl-tRNA hydrolase [Odoribacteraceae bacterium]